MRKDLQTIKDELKAKNKKAFDKYVKSLKQIKFRGPTKNVDILKNLFEQMGQEVTKQLSIEEKDPLNEEQKLLEELKENLDHLMSNPEFKEQLLKTLGELNNLIKENK